MGLLIDASILIEAERGRIDVRHHVARIGDTDVLLSVVTASELLHGVHRATDANIRARRSAFVEAVLEQFALLDVDVAVARAHARLWADLRAAGTPIGPHDLWLAATALAHGLTFVTGNVREFARVPGLDLEVWEPQR